MGRSNASFALFLEGQRRRVKRSLSKYPDRAQIRLRTRDPLNILAVQTRGSCGSLGQKRKDLSALDGTYDG